MNMIKYDKNGLPTCELCGKSFSRLMAHVRQTHNMNARSYKKQFGLDISIGILSKESRLKSSKAVHKNYAKVVTENLIKKGKKTRYKDNHPGRKIMSEQTRQRVSELGKTNMTTEQRIKKGKTLGKSGLGNKTRWGKTQD